MTTFRELLNEIDRKAEAGLCYFTLESVRAFLQDIREIIAEAPNNVHPTNDEARVDFFLAMTRETQELAAAYQTDALRFQWLLSNARCDGDTQSFTLSIDLPGTSDNWRASIDTAMNEAPSGT